MARLFRKSFLQKLGGEIDDLAFAVPERHLSLFWPTLFTATFAMMALSAWLFTAQIPITVKAQGVILQPGGVREIAALGNGVISGRRSIQHGKFKAGDILLTANAPIALAAHLDARQRYLSEVQSAEIQREAIKQNYDAQLLQIDHSLTATRENITRLSEIIASLEKAIVDHELVRKQVLETQQEEVRKISELYDQSREGIETLRERGITTQQVYIEYQQARVSALQIEMDTNASIYEAEIEKHRHEQEISELMDRVSSEEAEELSLIGRRQELLGQRKVDEEEIKLQEIRSRNELLDEERRLWFTKNIIAPYDGELIAMQATPGQPVNQGDVLAMINIQPQTRKLMLVISPEAKEGQLTFGYLGKRRAVRFQKTDADFKEVLLKTLHQLIPNSSFRIRLADENMVIIATNFQARQAIENLSLLESDLKGSSGVPAFSILFVIGDDWKDRELRMVGVLKPEDGKKVQLGSHALIKPAFEKSLIGTQIHARVTYVSNFSVTSTQADAIIGSTEIAQSLVGELEQGVWVILEFEHDAEGQPKLNGDVLSRDLSIGALAVSSIELKSETPIEILLPFYSDLAK